MNWDDQGLQGTLSDCKGLKRTSVDCQGLLEKIKGLRRVPRNSQGLVAITKDYEGPLGTSRAYTSQKLPGTTTREYQGLLGTTKGQLSRCSTNANCTFADASNHVYPAAASFARIYARLLAFDIDIRTKGLLVMASLLKFIYTWLHIVSSTIVDI